MKNAKNLKQTKFSLVEVLVVIGIIGILVAMIFPALSRVRGEAKKTKCVGQLDQISKGYIMYSDDNDGKVPFWLSNLYGGYLSAPDLLVCPEDPAQGKDGSRTGGEFDTVKEVIHPKLEDEFPETDDTNYRNTSNIPGFASDAFDLGVNGNQQRNSDIDVNSYLYEFAGVLCSWESSGLWWEVKYSDLKGGTNPVTNQSYNPSLFPVTRCFFHWTKIWGKDELTLNSSYDGGVFFSKFQWEYGVY